MKRKTRIIVALMAAFACCRFASTDTRAAGWRPSAQAARYPIDLRVGGDVGAYAYAPENVEPADQRERMRNPDGSCVQCSLAISGIHHNSPAAEMLLWDSEYGDRVRGGSWPERVSTYCRQRSIPIYNVTGRQTIDWIDWALTTGRYAAITWGSAHMITAVGISGDGGTYYVVDNNSPGRIDAYSRERFVGYHQRYGGGWAVIIKGPAPAPWRGPAVYPWWQN